MRAILRSVSRWNCGLVTGLVVSVTVSIQAAAADVFSPHSLDNIEPAKRELLERYLSALEDGLSDEEQPGAADGPHGASVDEPVEDAGRMSPVRLEFRGTDWFALEVTLDEAADKSYLGYVVDSPSDSYQDMVIAEDLRNLGRGVHIIQAACSDRQKDFPPTGYRMSSTPHTSTSEGNWAYWARRAAQTGVQENYSFDSLQAAIWYITDRTGNYNDFSLLRRIGYPSNGPSKNARSDDDGTDTVVGGMCPLASLMLVGGLMASLVVLRRRQMQD